MPDDKLTRRDFVYGSALATAGVAFGLTATKTVAAGNPQQEDTSKIVGYNPEMEYRRCGKTEMLGRALETHRQSSSPETGWTGLVGRG